MSGKPRNIVGQKFGMLTPVALLERRAKSGDAYWLFKCDCSKLIETTASIVVTGKTYNCGCLRGKNLLKHGKTSSGAWKSWVEMIRRCKPENAKKYPYHAGLGITVDESWLDFEKFYEDMGDRPRGMSIDRIDPYGNYKPGNCRWATAKEQARNRRLINKKRHGVATLLEQDVIFIKENYQRRSYGRSNAGELALKFNVDRTTIVKIATGKTWKYLKSKTQQGG